MIPNTTSATVRLTRVNASRQQDSKTPSRARSAFPFPNALITGGDLVASHCESGIVDIYTTDTKVVDWVDVPLPSSTGPSSWTVLATTDAGPLAREKWEIIFSSVDDELDSVEGERLFRVCDLMTLAVARVSCKQGSGAEKDPKRSECGRADGRIRGWRALMGGQALPESQP